MKVSVVMTTYNGSEYLQPMLDSLLNQSRMPDEVLILDDCSTDNTCEIIKDFIATHDLAAWKIVQNIKNKGWKQNFFDGITSASGDVVFTADQDDVWCSDKIETMTDIMENHDEINVLTSSWKEMGGNKDGKVLPEPEDDKLWKHELKYSIFLVPYPGCTYCIRSLFWQKIKKYWFSDSPHDSFMWKTALFSDSLYSVNTPLINWRKHSDSTFAAEKKRSHNNSGKKVWIESAIRNVRMLESFIKENPPQNEKYKAEVIKKNFEWLTLRDKFYKEKKIGYWLRLIKYTKLYQSKKQLLSDFYYVYFGTK